ncbi:MAG: hypothetical protein AB8F26_09670 [Phycisphaerales bacterium]
MTDNLMPTDSTSGGLPNAMNAEDDSLGLPGVGSPLGTSVAGSTGESAKKVSGQVVLAGAVLLLAAGAIYGMRFVGLNAAFGGENIKIDYTAEQGLESAKRFESVMAELEASMSAVQLAEGQLAAEPFSRPVEDAPEPGVYEEPNSMDDLDRLARLAAERRMQEMSERAQLVQGELMRLNVQGVIGGRVPAARINGQPVRVGNMLGVFEVVDISGQSVFVEADGQRYELRIGLEPRVVE